MDRLWNRNYCLVMMANSFLYLSFYLLMPLLPLYLNAEFGAGKDTIGVVLSGYTLAALLTRPFSGYVVDSFARKKVLMLCISVFSIFFLGYVAAGTLLLFAIVRTLHGVPFGAVTVANSTVAIDVLAPSRRKEGIGLYGLSTNIPMALAPSLGIYIYHLTNSFAPLFWIAFGFSAIAVLCAHLVKLKPREVVPNKRKISLDRFFLTRAWLLAINIALFGSCFGTLSNFLAIYSRDELGITSGTGTYFMLLSIGLIVSRLQGSKALREGRLTQNCAMGVGVSLTGYVLFVACPHPWAYYLSAILIGLGNGHMYPAFLNMFVAMARHDQRGTANSSILTSWDMGFGLGVLVGGLIAENISYQAAFWFVAAINAIGVILFFAATRRFFLERQLEEQ